MEETAEIETEVETEVEPRWYKTNGGRWVVVCPVNTVRAGDTLTVMKADGTATEVKVRGVSRAFDRGDGQYQFAYPEIGTADRAINTPVERVMEAAPPEPRPAAVRRSRKSTEYDDAYITSGNESPAAVESETRELPQPRWRKLAAGWAVEVPADTAKAGDTLTVARADGTATEVKIRAVSKQFDRDGQQYQFAYPEREDTTADVPAMPEPEPSDEVTLEQTGA